MNEIFVSGVLSLSNPYVANLNENFIDLLAFTYGSKYVQIDAKNPIRFTVLRQENGQPPVSQALSPSLKAVKELELAQVKMETLKNDNAELSKQVEWYKQKILTLTSEGMHKFLFEDYPTPQR